MKPFFLVAPSEKGKVLGIRDNKLSYCAPGEDGCHTVWFPHSVDDGFHIIVVNTDLALHYDENADEQVKVVPREQATEWHITNDGQIYTDLKSGEKKYLWSISDGVYVTPDEYLAENWKMVSMEGFDMTPDIADKHQWCFKSLSVVFWIILLLVIVGIVYILRKK
jgi:hypothetical protein